MYFNELEAKYKPRYNNFKMTRQTEEKKHREEYDQKEDMEKKYVPLYPLPEDYPNKSDPKAMRIRAKKDFWDWMTTYLTHEDDIKLILVKMEEHFRALQTPPIPEKDALTDQQKNDFETFRQKACNAVGVASEMASFIIYSNQAVELFKGELKDLKLYGPSVDPYLVPVINALVPVVDPNVEPAIFKE